MAVDLIEDRGNYLDSLLSERQPYASSATVPERVVLVERTDPCGETREIVVRGTESPKAASKPVREPDVVS